MTAGRFYGIGLGPGDPELITRKAARVIGESDVIAYHAGVNKQSYARTIAADLIPADAVEEELRYPLTTGTTDHPGGYAGALAEFYEQSAARLARHLEAGRTVALLAEGDPLFYGSFMYMHDRLSTRFATEIVPGIPAFTAATAAVASPLVRQTDVLTVLPGTLPEAELARRLADTDGAIIMKLGRTFPAVRRALAAAGRLDHAMYVERASHPQQRWMPVADVDEAGVPYLSLIVVNGDSINGPRSRVMVEEPRPATVSASTGIAELLVIGLGPGPDGWMTPEAAAALAEVAHVVGYAPYVARVPQREGLQRHASGNTVELDRARFALELALPRRIRRRRLRRRRRGVRDGLGGIRGRRRRAIRRDSDPGAARRVGRPGRRRTGRCAAGRGLRRDEPVGPAQAVVGDRAETARHRRGRSCSGDLQPRLACTA